MSRMKKSGAKKSKTTASKNGISTSEKGVNGQRSIISMFRQQSDKTVVKKELSQPISKDVKVMHPQVVPSTSDDKNSKVNKLSLKRRHISECYEDFSYHNQGIDESSSASKSLFSTSCNGNCSAGDINCIDGKKIAYTCISNDSSEVSISTLTHESSDINYLEKKYGTQVKAELNKNQHSNCNLSEALRATDHNHEFHDQISTKMSKSRSELNEQVKSVVLEESDPVQGNKPSEHLDELPLEDEFDDGGGEILDGEERGTSDYIIPYYLENFLLIIDTVMDDDYYRSLFDDQDLFHITIFKSLSGKNISL